MIVFLFVVCIYISANYYLFHQLSAINRFGTIVDAIAGMIILFMTVAPVLLPIYEHRGSSGSVKIFSLICYIWLALLVPFFPLAVLLDLYNAGIRYAASMNLQLLSLPVISSESTLLTPFVISLLITTYGYFEAKNIKVTRLTLQTGKLPEAVNRIRVAQISDLHLRVIEGDDILDNVVTILEDEKPDLIVSTGDLMDGSIRHIKHLAEPLQRLQPPLGKFAVTGNHELYGGIKKTTRFIEDSGFTLLRGEAVTVGNALSIAGIDFTGGEAKKYSSDFQYRPEKEVLAGLPAGLFTLLLKHRSDVEKDSLGLFDLQLSGHTHRGQIFPMHLATMFLFQHHTGFIELSKGSAIYVSRGTGTAGPPVRFLSAPEVTIIDIVAS